jgi:hypothetical protein
MGGYHRRQEVSMPVRRQLRIYRIAVGHMDEFIDGWRAGVLPLRRRFGFEIEAAWSSTTDDRFCWLVRYDGEGTFEEADHAYYASPERKGLTDDPARFIVEAGAFMVEPALGPDADAQGPPETFDPPP